jgi:hypothetical protein
MSGEHHNQDNTEEALDKYKVETPDHVKGKVDKAEKEADARQEKSA